MTFLAEKLKNAKLTPDSLIYPLTNKSEKFIAKCLLLSFLSFSRALLSSSFSFLIKRCMEVSEVNEKVRRIKKLCRFNFKIFERRENLFFFQ